MSLGRNYRFHVANAVGQTIAAAAITLTARRWYYSSTGVQTWEASQASLYSNASVANGGFDSSSGIDNSAVTPAPFLGAEFIYSVTVPASSSGTVSLYLQRSTDGGTTWPDNGTGTLLWTNAFTATGTQVRSFTF
jgi:hypothetical protein